MSFAQLTPTSPELAQEHTNIALAAEELGLKPKQLSALKSVVQWQTMLTSDGPEPKQSVQTMLAALGYLPEDKRTLAQAERNTSNITACASALMERFASSQLTPEEFVQKTPVQIKLDFPELNKSQIKLLQSIMQQQLNLDKLEVSGLVSQFPFPITQTNFFGRFLAGGCEEPQKAARHLQISSPFFVRLRSALEGLSNPKKNYLTIEVTSAAEEAEAERGGMNSGPLKKHNSKRDNTEVYDTLLACINHSSDFVGGQVTQGIDRPLVVLEMPRLPYGNIDQFDRHQRSELAVALYDWLLFGKRNSELLTQRKLSVASEKEDQSDRNALKKAETALKRIQLKQPGEDDTPYRHRQWEKRLGQLESEIANLKRDIRETAAKRSAVKPLIRQLEGDESAMSSVRAFRKQLAGYDPAKARLVLSFLKSNVSGPYGSSPFIELLDQAVTTRKFNASPAISLLKNASCLLSPEVEAMVAKNRVGGFDSIAEQKVRPFMLNRDELNSSLQFMISGILPERVDPNIKLLLDSLLENSSLPGILKPADLRYLVSEATGKRKPGADDYLNFAFERTTELTRPQFHAILATLRSLGIDELPPRCIELAEQRFRLPTGLIPKFEVYTRNYTPQKLGTPPDMFEDLATFERYTTLKLDAAGMSREVREIERHLAESGMVALVDGTNYHPELRTEIGMTGDTLKADDVAKTNEIWGDYIRPSERALRSLTLRLVEGDVSSSLENHSLLAVRKPEKAHQIFQKIIKKMYGLDIDISPDLAQINQVLADLTVHDDKSILVLDAEQVTNLQQYREFLDLLARYQLKIIVRTREPIPGIPQVNIQPFLEHDIADRLMTESESLAMRLGINKPLSKELLDFTVAEVKRNRAPGADPLNLVLQVLDGAANHARYYPDASITEQDIVAASASIFKRPDGTQMRLRLEAIDSFAERAPAQVLGQEKPIKTVADRMRSHILGMRDPTRPLTILLPGPTGVGKTELMMYFAQACDIPFFMVEGAEFSEEHTVSRLVGSPSGYVGPDEGILFRFLKDNEMGLVFIDEIEKMHPSVYQSLMNFFDKATLTSGAGETVRRPGFIIVGASNAGADQLHREMTAVEVREVLADSFVDRFGRSRPELVRRFEPIPMLAIELEGFQNVLKANLNSIGNRPGFVSSNLRLTEIDDKAVSLLYQASREVCEFNERSITGRGSGQIGFGALTNRKEQSDLFYDMRHISRALDTLAGPSLQQMAIEQYDSGRFAERGNPRLVRLVGIEEGETGRIELVDASSTDRDGTMPHRLNGKAAARMTS